MSLWFLIYLLIVVSGVFHEELHKDFVHPAKSQAVIKDLTTLIENDAEAFALGPIEVNTKGDIYL